MQREYGQPFADVMRELVLEPIGMDASTFDRDTIRTTVDRAIGHESLIPEVPLDVPMTAAGGLYSNVGDLSRFLSFQLGNGSINQRVVLDPGLMNEMRTVPAPHQGAIEGYALGVDRTRWVAGHNADLFSHSGGGFGFIADLWWLPQLQLGIAVLTNLGNHSLQGDLAISVLSDLTHEPGSIYRERLSNLPIQGGLGERGKAYELPTELPALVASVAQPPIGDESERWGSYCADFLVRGWGAVDPRRPSARFLVEDGIPYFETSEESTT